LQLLFVIAVVLLMELQSSFVIAVVLLMELQLLLVIAAVLLVELQWLLVIAVCHFCHRQLAEMVLSFCFKSDMVKGGLKSNSFSDFSFCL